MNIEFAKDLIGLVNSLKGLQKKGSVKYNNTEFKYVLLEDILEVIKNNDKFAFMQPMGNLNEKEAIKCLLVHESGETMESEWFPLDFKEGQKPQDKGSIMTYMRRYTVSSFFGLSSDDDNDGQGVKSLEEIKELEEQAKAKQNAKFQKQIKDSFNKLLTEFGVKELVYAKLGMSNEEFITQYNSDPKQLATLLETTIKKVNE